MELRRLGDFERMGVSTEVKVSALELGFFSIPVTDMAIAKSFYEKVMGWSIQERDPAFTYAFANDDMIGALELANADLKPSNHGPLMYFRASTMKKTLEDVSRSGGRVQNFTAI